MRRATLYSGCLGYYVVVLSTLLTLGYSTAGYAQQGVDSLASIEALVAKGETARARVSLAEWWQSTMQDGAAPEEIRARALLLRARLSTEPDDALDDYLALALGYPATPQAPAALLALGQILHAEADYQRAATYLERLIRNYPSSQSRPIAYLWLARVNQDAERPNAACNSARQGGALPHDPEMIDLLQEVETSACAAAASGIADKPFAPAPGARSTDAPTTGEPPARTSAAPRITLQMGAFKDARGAAVLAARLRSAGFEPRIVTLDSDPLHRVRIGHFSTTGEAESVARKVRAAGFDVVIATDIANERPVP